MKDRSEFHLGGQIIAWPDSSFAPAVGELVNIRKTTYRVIGRTWTVDYADDALLRSVVCVVNLEEIEK